MITPIAAVALICALLLALLDGLGFKSKRLFGVLCLVLIMISAASYLPRLFGPFADIAEDMGLSDAASCALRAIGLGYVFGFTSDICSSLGETGLSSIVTTAGKIEIFLVALPFFEKAISLSLSLLK